MESTHYNFLILLRKLLASDSYLWKSLAPKNPTLGFSNMSL